MCLHKFVKLVTSSVIVRFYIEQVFVLVHRQFHNDVYTQPVKRFDRAMQCIYTISNLECCKCTRMRFHCANALVVLSSCAL